MKLAAKRAPQSDSLEKAYSEGFNYTEIFLTKPDLDDMENTITNIKNAEIDSIAVHTPHVSLKDRLYINKTIELAKQLGTFTIFHSSSIFINDAVSYGERFDHPYIGYEHDPGFSRRGIENLILDRGKKLVLDTAHLYIGAESYQNDLKNLLNRTDHIHLCDSTTQRDGLPLGDGNMDIETTACIIERSPYNEYVVLEVMPEHQPEALNKVQSYCNMC